MLLDNGGIRWSLSIAILLFKAISLKNQIHVLWKIILNPTAEWGWSASFREAKHKGQRRGMVIPFQGTAKQLCAAKPMHSIPCRPYQKDQNCANRFSWIIALN